MTLRACLLSGACTALLAGASAQSPAELIDIRGDAIGSGPSDPAVLTEAGSRLYFSAEDGIHGRELWTTDGTPGGTYMVRDMNPGRGSSWSARGVVFDGRYYFPGFDGQKGTELWVSDGSEAGTYLLLDLRPGAYSGRPGDLTVLNDSLMFFADHAGSNTRSLWKSDGTAAGTSLVMEFDGRASGNSPMAAPVHFDGGLVFVRYATDDPGPTPAQLWFTDGTHTGTVMIAAFAYIDVVATLDEKIVVFARDPTNGQGIYVSAGPGSGAQWVTQMYDVSAYAKTDGNLLFYGFDSSFGAALWRTDGTPDGTRVVEDMRSVYPGPVYPLAFAELDQRHFFLTRGNSGGLWVTDGTEAGTFQVFEVGDLGAGATEFSDLRVAGDTLYFTADETDSGREMWRSDGTLEGTALLNDIAPADGSSQPRSNYLGERAVLNDRLVFVADDGVRGRELWQSGADGKSARLLKDIRSRHGSRPEQLTAVGDWLYFIAGDGSSGRNVWRSDGTPERTSQIAVVLGDTQTEYFLGRVYPRLTIQHVAGTDVYFSMQDQAGYGSGRTDLWISRSARNDTHSLGQISVSGLGSVSLGALDDGATVFGGRDDAAGRELWRSDGTPLGTGLAADISPGTSHSSPAGFALFGGYSYFSAFESTLGREVWRSDGTPAGTTLVKDINAGSGSSIPFGFTSTDSLIYFRARPAPGVADTELWRSDGTPEGTFMVRGDNSDGSFSPSPKVAVGSTLYFLANDVRHGFELWRSEGDDSSTWRVTDIYPGFESSLPRDIMVFGGELFFVATDGVHGRELWRSDGTDAGSKMVRDIWPGPGHSAPADLVVFDDFILFTANNGTRGREIWLSDGSRGGTMSLAKIRPLPGASNAAGLTVAGNSLFFSADHESAGIELWRLGGLDDIDDDGLQNRSDNCFTTSNPIQADTDGDGIGNACDPDFNQDCMVNALDLALFRQAFSTNEPLYDLNEDGVVDARDLGRLKRMFFATPGPATPASVCK